MLRRIPDYKLTARRVHQIVLIDVARLAGASASVAERYLAQTPYLPHCVRAAVSIHHINVVVCFVRMAKTPVLCELSFYENRVYGGYYILHNNRLLWTSETAASALLCLLPLCSCFRPSGRYCLGGRLLLRPRSGEVQAHTCKINKNFEPLQQPPHIPRSYVSNHHRYAL